MNINKSIQDIIKIKELISQYNSEHMQNCKGRLFLGSFRLGKSDCRDLFTTEKNGSELIFNRSTGEIEKNLFPKVD